MVCFDVKAEGPEHSHNIFVPPIPNLFESQIDGYRPPPEEHRLPHCSILRREGECLS